MTHSDGDGARADNNRCPNCGESGIKQFGDTEPDGTEIVYACRAGDCDVAQFTIKQESVEKEIDERLEVEA